MSNEIRVLGPPGTGKTRKLAMEIIPELAQKYGPEKLMITSLTKAAAAELSSRIDLGESDIVGTLHSICFRALKLNRSQMTEANFNDWNEKHISYRLSGDSKDPGPKYFSMYQLFKNKMIPRDNWPSDLMQFTESWERWKQENYLYDFVDLVEEAGRMYSPPGSPMAIVCDETQDFTVLEMHTLRLWSSQVHEFWTVGDDDQCSVIGTIVSTVNGKKPIEELDPSVDHLKIYAKSNATIYGGQVRQYSFDIAHRLYSGLMYRFYTDSKETFCTSNHKWYVKWNPYRRQAKWYIVYLMRKNNWYRVGRCQLFRDEGNRPNSFHPGVRMDLEDADELWILKVFDDKTDANIYENYISAEFGLSLVLFAANQRERAVKLLNEHELSIAYPFCSKTGRIKQHSGKSIMQLTSANIAVFSKIDDFFLVPMEPDKGRYINWTPFRVDSKFVENETVYSLDVEKYHTYIADGFCTCNSLYFFNGASVDNMLLPEIPDNQKIILGQSYRVPKTVHAVAQSIIARVKNREPKEYKPKDLDGEVLRCQGNYNKPDWVVNKAIELPGHSMIMASCEYMLGKTIEILRSKGILYSNPWKPDQKSWNPLTTGGCRMLKGFLSHGEDAPFWETGQLLEWIEALMVGENGLIRGQGKKGIKQIKELYEKDPSTPGLHTCREYIDQLLSPDAIEPAMNRDVEWLLNNVTKAKALTLRYPVQIYNNQGADALYEEPRIHVGTIHSFKGAGAENIFVFPDLSSAAQSEKNTVEGRENLCRLFYVAVTRSKDKLFIMSKGSKFSFNI